LNLHHTIINGADAWLLIAQSNAFQTVTPAVSSYVVVHMALRGFQQLTGFKVS
jgi:hypothetical protein